MKRFRLQRPSPAMAVALLSLVVAMGGTGYAAINLPKNSVGTKQIKRNAVVSSKVKKDTLTGDDVNESRLGAVPAAGRADSAGNADQLGGKAPDAYVESGQKVGQSEHADTADTATSATTADTATSATSATNATNATNADTVDSKNASDFVGTTTTAGGDLAGTFSNLSLASGSVDDQSVENDSLTDLDLLDYQRSGGALDDSTSNAIPTTVVLDGGSGATITAVCNKSAANITGSITITNPNPGWAVTSDAPNGQVGQVGVAASAERTLIQVGPTAANAFSHGSFYMTEGTATQIAGFVAVQVNRFTDQCDFSVTRFGI